MFKKLIVGLVMCLSLTGCTSAKANNEYAVFSWGEPKAVQSYAFSTVYQSVDFSFADGNMSLDTEQAKQYLEYWRGRDVYLLCGNTDWVEAEITKATELAKESGFKGLVLDCEVWVDGVSKEQREASVAGIKETVDKTDIPILVCTPYWNEDNEKLANCWANAIHHFNTYRYGDFIKPNTKYHSGLDV